MSTITRTELASYVANGWSVIERDGSNVAIVKRSHVAEDVGRSIAYTVTAPVVVA